MNRNDFKKELAKHRTQIEASIEYLQKGFSELNKRNYEFYEFLEENEFDLEERVTILERKMKELT